MVTIILSLVVSLILGFGLSYYQISIGQTVLLRGGIGVTIMMAVFAVVVFILGILVWRYKKGKLPSLKGLTAYNILVLSQTAILAGEVLLGIYGGTLLGEFKVWDIVFNKFVPEIPSIIAAVVLIISGAFALWMCHINPPKDFEVKDKSYSESVSS
ncbi:MAG: DUF3180 family protein [Candidatus Ancillula sp.]|jgi:hypothetical protein|nr:DUF3180 family protein [Candidatus Ancillula sp.]